MTLFDRICLTAIIAAGLWCWFAFPFQMASVLLTLAVLAMLFLSVHALQSGAKRMWGKTRTRQPGRAPRSPNTHTNMKVIR